MDTVSLLAETAGHPATQIQCLAKEKGLSETIRRHSGKRNASYRLLCAAPCDAGEENQLTSMINLEAALRAGLLFDYSHPTFNFKFWGPNVSSTKPKH